MNKVSILIIALLAIVLLGCRVGPKYCLPIQQINETWHSDSRSDSHSDSHSGSDSRSDSHSGSDSHSDSQSISFSHTEPVGLEQLFDDELLAEYLQQLATENHDVQLASAKVYEALALRKISFAKLFPIIDGRIAYNSAKPAGGILEAGAPNMSGASSSVNTGANSGALDGIPLNLKSQTFISDFDAVWEIDLFGRRRWEVGSATAYVQMNLASYRSILVSLMAEFARTYLELRRNQHHFQLINKEIEILNEKNKAVQERLLEGLDSEFLSLDNQIALDQLSAQVKFYEREIISLMYRLSVLLGKAPESLTEELSKIKEVPKIKETIPIGFPSELLRRRPDIRLAEYEVDQATAELGMAVADLFPKLTLVGNYGFENLHLGAAKGAGESWGFGGGLFAPIFHGGSLKANVERNDWRRQESFINYEKAVLTAFEEVESSINRFDKSEQILKIKTSVNEKTKELLGHMEKRFDHGLVNYLQLLDSQINSIQSEIDEINAKIDSEIQLIALFKALGGAFDEGGCECDVGCECSVGCECGLGSECDVGCECSVGCECELGSE